MEQEEYLREEIQSYFDQLNLLSMQDNADLGRIDSVTVHIKELVEEYASVLSEKVEVEIQKIERRFAYTLEDELEKRRDILTIVQERDSKIRELFFNNGRRPKLKESLKPLFDSIEQEVTSYQSDVNLVEQQLDAIREADQKEEELNAEKKRCQTELNVLRSEQISYSRLDERIIAAYQRILTDNNIEQIDFPSLIEKKRILEKRQKQLLENLELARNAKNADNYRITYEARLERNKLDIDEIEEKNFLHLLNKMMQKKVSSYEELERRTKSIQTLVDARKAKVQKLYAEGVTVKEKYATVAEKINHSEITLALSSLIKIEELERQIAEIEEKLSHTRDHIKVKEELEEIFNKKAVDSGRTPGIPEIPPEPVQVKDDFVNQMIDPKDEELEEPIVSPTEEVNSAGETVMVGDTELTFEEDFSDFELLTPDQINADMVSRSQVLAVEEAQPGLLKKLFSGKLRKILSLALATVSLFISGTQVANAAEKEEAAENIINEENLDTSIQAYDENAVVDTIAANVEAIMKEKYAPSIGDKIQLNPGAALYTTSTNAVSGVQGYEASASGLSGTDLYVTRGAIIDQTGNPIYITTTHSVDINKVATDMGLVEGTYGIALGCSSGDMEGNFVEVPVDQLNPAVEKGWINSADPNIVVIEQLNKQLGQGGMSL
ncbi:MAG: hypothetical protein HFH31_02535 [Bacilli bacterium]|nr:hypothetical protein [Bacilli bacterium]